MPIIATAPLLVEPGDRALAEHTLTVIARCRFVSRASLFAALGPRGLGAEMIDGWVQAGLLHEGSVRLDPLMPSETRYLALTKPGARALSAATGTNAEGMTPARLHRSSQKRAHDISVGELGLSVMALSNDALIDLVGVETDDQRLGFGVTLAEPGQAPERISLRPDALIVARCSMGRVGLLVEVDRGTVSLKTMARRFRAYFAWQHDGGPSRDFGIKALRVLTVAPNETRLKALHDEASEVNGARPSGFLVFTLQDDLSVCTAERWLGPVAHQLGAVPGNRVPLLPSREPGRAEAA